MELTVFVQWALAVFLWGVCLSVLALIWMMVWGLWQTRPGRKDRR